jgi:hypothetical protein
VVNCGGLHVLAEKEHGAWKKKYDRGAGAAELRFGQTGSVPPFGWTSGKKKWWAGALYGYILWGC